MKFEPGEFERLQAAALAVPYVVSETAYIELSPHLAPERQNVAGYAVCQVTSEAGQILRLYVGSDDAARSG